MPRLSNNSLANLSPGEISNLFSEANMASLNSQITAVEPRIIKENGIQTEAEGEGNNHVVNKSLHSNQDKSDKLNQDITKILTSLEEVREAQLKDRQSFNNQAAESKEAIIALPENNNKMAAELEAMKITVLQLEDENKSLRGILDIKQNDWIQVESKKAVSTRNVAVEDNTAKTTSNRFDILEVEGEDEDNSQSSNLSSDAIDDTKESLQRQMTDYRDKQERKFKHAKGKSMPQVTSGPNKYHQNHMVPNHKSNKKVLLIGDSMVKHMDNKKLGRAARCKVTCHSYGGAKIKDISTKIKDLPNVSDQG